MPAAGGDGETRLLVRRAGTEVKVEINTVIRGTVHPLRHEVLFPQLRDIRADYEQNFVGMTTEPVELAALIEARDRMIKELQLASTPMNGVSYCLSCASRNDGYSQ